VKSTVKESWKEKSPPGSAGWVKSEKNMKSIVKRIMKNKKKIIVFCISIQRLISLSKLKSESEMKKSPSDTEHTPNPFGLCMFVGGPLSVKI